MRNGRIIDSNGTVLWYLNYQRHREDGPAVERADGSCVWYLNGRLHREDGPAVEYADGSCLWYVHDQLHRETGPAIERIDGSCEWWLYDKEYSLVEWLDCVDISPEQRTLLLLKWGGK